MPRKYYKTYYWCASQTEPKGGYFGPEETIKWSSITFNGDLEGDDGAALELVITEANAFPLGSVSWTITPEGAIHDHYHFSWTALNKDGTETEYIVELIKIDYCEVEMGKSECSDDENLILLTWLTREGGWAYFAFFGKTTFTIKIPDGKTFVQSDYVKRYNERPEVYNGKVATSGSISELLLDLIESLKYSVQVYEIKNPFTGSLQPTLIPIVIDAEDFIKKKTGDRFFDVSVKYIYADRVQIQTQ